MRGQKITLYLIEGLPGGIIKAQLSNWVGLVTQAPRTKLNDLAADVDVRRPGVYVLVGANPANGDQLVYIGESENVLSRLKQHEKDETKEFFEQVTIITSTNENLTKGHVRYLEARLIEIAHENKRATILNGTNPDHPPLPRADRDEMEGFLDNLEVLLPVLGLDFALPRPQLTKPSTRDLTQTSQAVQVESPIFEITTNERGTRIQATAKAQQINAEFVVFSGSTALVRNESSGSYKELKDRLIRNGSLMEKEGLYVFTEDVPFKSPSAAAAIIRGQNTNGRTYWRLQGSITTYGEWFDARIDAEEIITSDEE